MKPDAIANLIEIPFITGAQVVDYVDRRSGFQ
jgi:hypothetical protein